MKVLVFVSDDGTDAGTGPILFIKDVPDAILPPNPRGMAWRYFATVDVTDQLLDDERDAIRRSLSDDEPYIAHRLLRTLPKAVQVS